MSDNQEPDQEPIVPGDIVTAPGYGGWAEVINVVEDGYAPNGAPKYRAYLKFGPYNDQYGASKQSRVFPHDFAAGRLTKITETDDEHQQRVNDRLEQMDEAALLARLAQLRAKQKAK